MSLASGLPDATLMAPFVTQLRREAFAPGAADRLPRIGAEVEFLPVVEATGRMAAIDAADGPATLPVLRALAAELGWREHRSSKAGVPEFRTPSGGRLTFEPGGQIEYAAAPADSASALLADLRTASSRLEDALGPSGIELASVGVDPHNDIADVPLQLHAERYRRMDAHFARIGPHGARMMRQTASIQVSVDAGSHPLERWALLNSLTPWLVAIFANSPVYAGVSTGHRSVRRHIWGALDSARTGIAWAPGDPVAAYARFAMSAGAILLGDEGEPSQPFSHHARRGADLDQWRAHLTTLFPEVRPRGYFEVRSIDALDPAWYAAPLVFLCGLAYVPDVARRAARVAGDPDTALLVRAGRCALTDSRLAEGARALTALALEGADSLGPHFVLPRDARVAAEFFDRYTLRARSPADDMLSPAGV